MKIVRRSMLAAALVLLLALGSAATAGAAPTASPRCERLANQVEQWQQTKDGVTTLVTQFEQRLASGGLRPAQARAARTTLAALRGLVARLDATLGVLEGRYAATCSDTGGEDPAPEPDPSGGE